MPAPSFQAQLAIFALPTGACILPILLAHRPLDRAFYAFGQAQLEQVGPAAPLGFAHHRLIAEANIAADQPRLLFGRQAIQILPQPGARNAWRCAGCRAQPPTPAPAADCRSCNSDNCATVARVCADCSSPPHLPGAHRAVSPLCRYRESTARLAAAAWCNRDALAASPRRRLLRSCRGRAARHPRSPPHSFLTVAD